MNKLEFKKATKLALNPELTGTFDNIQIFDGFGLNGFKPVACTLKDMAGLIKWQCLKYDGNIDTEALDAIWSYRRRFTICG